jgi:DNA-binding response OmpR family regulator
MRSPENATWKTPRKLLLVHRDAGYRKEVLPRLQARGVDVTPAGTAEATHALAAEIRPHLVILDADLPDQSGALTCAKLKISHPSVRVILVGRHWNGEQARLARLVGADAYVSQSEGPAALLRHAFGRSVPATC